MTRAISLCESCEEGLPTLNHACKQCGLPLDVEDENISICGQCLAAPNYINYTRCVYHYQSPIDYLITTLKYKRQLSHATILSSLLLKHIQNAKNDLPDCIFPVPLHKKRLVKRGFNQSLEIAKPISNTLGIPIDIKSIVRNKHTTAQTELNAIHRKKNVKGCFEISSKSSFNYEHVVIVDDVITTGSTINEMAKQLKRVGVKKVGVWSIARAVLGS